MSQQTDPARKLKFKIGPYSELFFGLRELRQAQRVFKGQRLTGEGGVLENLGPDSVCHLASVGFAHEGNPVSDDIIEALINAEPGKLLPLIASCRAAVLIGYSHFMPEEMRAGSGEVKAALTMAVRAAENLAAGQTSQPSSPAPIDSGSNQPSSGG